ncbi:CE57L protein, partial [Steatornis caripensis]|nr:CE57L protein [Steatornis caripensis]
IDSESKNIFRGSFLQPPDKTLPAAFAYTESKKLAAFGGDWPSIPNNQAVVGALKTRQEKIHHLELEKSQTEDNLCSLIIAASQYNMALKHESYTKDTAHQELMQQRKDLSVQLQAAQSRCSLLEKQLDYMWKMVSSAELEKKIVLEQQAQLQKEEDQKWLELHAKLEKLEMLEKECLTLTATQRIAEDKIKRLEEKLCNEEHQHKLIEDKTAQWQRNPTTKKMHLSKLHVKAGELPFMAGKVTTSGISGHSTLSKFVSSRSTSPTTTKRLSDLLLAKMSKGQMSFEHQQLLKKIKETQDSKVCEDLEWELGCLVKQMEIKGEQMSQLKKRQATVQNLERKTQKLKQGAAHAKLNCGNQKEANEITVTVRESMSKSCPGQKSRSSLQLLRNARKLQSALKKDGIMWEK